MHDEIEGDQKENIPVQIHMNEPYHEKFRPQKYKNNFIVPTSIGYHYIPLPRQAPKIRPPALLVNPVPVPNQQTLLPEQESLYNNLRFSQITKQLDYNIPTEHSDETNTSLDNNKYRIQAEENLRELNQVKELYESEKLRKQTELEYYIKVANTNKEEYIRLEIRCHELEFQNSALKETVNEFKRKQAEAIDWRTNKFMEAQNKIKELTARNEELSVNLLQANSQLSKAQLQIRGLGSDIADNEALKQVLQKRFTEQAGQLFKQCQKVFDRIEAELQKIQQKHHSLEKKIERSDAYFVKEQLAQQKQKFAALQQQKRSEIQKLEKLLREKERAYEELKSECFILQQKSELQNRNSLSELEALRILQESKDKLIKQMENQVANMKLDLQKNQTSFQNELESLSAVSIRAQQERETLQASNKKLKEEILVLSEKLQKMTFTIQNNISTPYFNRREQETVQILRLKAQNRQLRDQIITLKKKALSQSEELYLKSVYPQHQGQNLLMNHQTMATTMTGDYSSKRLSLPKQNEYRNRKSANNLLDKRDYMTTIRYSTEKTDLQKTSTSASMNLLKQKQRSLVLEKEKQLHEAVLKRCRLMYNISNY